MKKNLSVLLLSVLILGNGCVTGDSHSKKYTYPSYIESMCHKAREDAKNCFVSKGERASESKGIVLKVIDGQKKINGEWSFYSDIHKSYVCGLSRLSGGKVYITVCCDPKTKNVDYNIVKHEHGHYYRLANFGDYGHNAKFKSCFVRWYDLQSKTYIQGEDVIIVDYMIENENNHK